MHKSKQKFRFINSHTKKILSFFTVFILLTTAIASIVSSKGLFDKAREKIEEIKSNNDIISERPLLEGLKEKIENLREKTKIFLQNVVKRRNHEVSKDEKTESTNVSGFSFVQTLRMYQNLKSTGSSFDFCIKYNDVEKNTTLSLLKQVKIDINYDGTNDIGARLSILPGIEKPLSLTINFKITITQLNGFKNLDKNASFEAYSEIRFPGILLRNLKDNKIRFGYQSPKNEEIPDNFEITYKFQPNLLSLTKKPSHKINVNPGSITGEHGINIVFDYYDSERKSETELIVEYSFATKTEISFARNKTSKGFIFGLERKTEESPAVTMRITYENSSSSTSVGLLISKLTTMSFSLDLTPLSSGGGKVEYEKLDDAQVDIALFVERENTGYLYVKDLPSHIVFSWQLEKNGYVNLNTYGEAASEVGLCDNYPDSINKVFLTNLPSVLSFNWNITPWSERKINFTGYSNSSGLSLKGHFENDTRVFDFTAVSRDNLNFSIQADLEEGYCELDRNNIDMSFLFKYYDLDRTIECNFDISWIDEEPLRIIFDELFDENMQVGLAGTELTLSNVYLKAYTPKLGDIEIKMDKLVKEKTGSLTVNLTENSMEIDEITGKFNLSYSCRFVVLGGINITNLAIVFNGKEYNLGNRTIIGDRVFWFNITVDATVEWHISEDKSTGYILIKGGQISSSIDSKYYRNGKLFGLAQGIVVFNANNDVFNISWKTFDGVKRFTITGGIILSNFYLWVNDTIELTIPKFSGYMTLINSSFDTGRLLLEFDDQESYLDFNLKLGPTQIPIFEFAYNVDNFHFDPGDKSGMFEFGWDEEYLSIGYSAENEVNLSIGDMDFYMLIDGEYIGLLHDNDLEITLENLTGYIYGPFSPELQITIPIRPINITNANLDRFAVNLNNTEFYLLIDDLNISGLTMDLLYKHGKDVPFPLDLGRIELSAESIGKNTISLVSLTVESTDHLYGMGSYNSPVNPVTCTWLNVTVAIDARDGEIDLHLLDVENTQALIILYTDAYFPYKTHMTIDELKIEGYTNFTYGTANHGSVEYNSSGLMSTHIIFENDPGTTVTLDRLHLCFPEISLEHLIENITDADVLFSPATLIVFEDLSLTSGVFDFYFETLGDLKIRFGDASALVHLDFIGIEFPGYGFIKLFSFKEPFEYLFFDLNTGTNYYGDWYIQLDTHNTTCTFDMQLYLTSDFLNLTADILSNVTEMSIPHAKNDFGLRVENVTIKADDYRIWEIVKLFYSAKWAETYEASKFNITGYLSIYGEGNIWILLNGSWIQFSQVGEGCSFIAEPGHIQLEINQHLHLEKATRIVKDYNITIGGTFISEGVTLDVWWDEAFENITLQIYGKGITIEDFILEIDDKLSLQIPSMSIAGGAGGGTASFVLDFENGNATVTGDFDTNGYSNIILAVDLSLDIADEESLYLGGTLIRENAGSAHIHLEGELVKNESLNMVLSSNSEDDQLLEIENFQVTLSDLADFYIQSIERVVNINNDLNFSVITTEEDDKIRAKFSFDRESSPALTVSGVSLKINIPNGKYLTIGLGHLEKRANDGAEIIIEANLTMPNTDNITQMLGNISGTAKLSLAGGSAIDIRNAYLIPSSFGTIELLDALAASIGVDLASIRAMNISNFLADQGINIPKFIDSINSNLSNLLQQFGLEITLQDILFLFDIDIDGLLDIQLSEFFKIIDYSVHVRLTGDFDLSAIEGAASVSIVLVNSTMERLNFLLSGTLIARNFKFESISKGYGESNWLKRIKTVTCERFYIHGYGHGTIDDGDRALLTVYAGISALEIENLAFETVVSQTDLGSGETVDKLTISGNLYLSSSLTGKLTIYPRSYILSTQGSGNLLLQNFLIKTPKRQLTIREVNIYGSGKLVFSPGTETGCGCGGAARVEVIIDCNVDLSNLIFKQQDDAGVLKKHFEIEFYTGSIYVNLNFRSYPGHYAWLYYVSETGVNSNLVNFDVNIGEPATYFTLRRGSSSTEFHAGADYINKYFETDWSHNSEFDLFEITHDGKTSKFTNVRESNGDLYAEWQETDGKVNKINVTTSSGVYLNVTRWSFSVDDEEVFAVSQGALSVGAGKIATIDLSYDESDELEEIYVDFAEDFEIEATFSLFNLLSLTSNILPQFLDVHLSDKYAIIGASGEFDLSIDIKAGLIIGEKEYNIDRVSTRSPIFDGSLRVCWGDNLGIEAYVNRLSLISEIEVYTTNAERSIIRNLKINDTAAIWTAGEGFKFVGKVEIESFKFKNESSVDKILVQDITIDGDLLIKPTTGREGFTLESENGISIDSQKTKIRVLSLLNRDINLIWEFGTFLEIQGDITVIFGGEEIIRFETSDHFSGRLCFSIYDWNITLLDWNWTGTNVLKLDWDLTDNGFIYADYINYDLNPDNLCSIEMHKEDTGAGIKFEGENIDIDNLRVEWDPGILLPIKNIQKVSGSMDYDWVDIDIKLPQFASWINVYPIGNTYWDPTANANGPYVVTRDNPVVRFNAFGSHDNDENDMYINKIRWNVDGETGWETGSSSSDYWINYYFTYYTYDFTPMFDSWDNSSDPECDCSNGFCICSDKIASKSYYAKLEVKDDEGATDRDLALVTIIFAYPGVDFEYTPANPEVDNAVHFSDKSSVDGTIDSYSWDFGDGTTSTEQNPDHTYTQTGTYDVTLTITYEGMMDSCTETISVSEDITSEPPIAIIDVNHDAGYRTTEFEFDGSDSEDPLDEDGYIVSWLWDFGDGKEDTGVTVTHTYKNLGTYDVVLTVTDNTGETDTETKTITVNNKGPDVVIDVTSYQIWDPNHNEGSTDDSWPNDYLEISGDKNIDYTFRGTRSSDDDGTIVAYQWERTGGSCFLAGTRVSMADGSYKNIEDIKVGDLVVSYNEEEQTLISKKVTKTHHHSTEEMTEYYLIINGRLQVTYNHCMFVNGRWDSAGNINIGDKLLLINDEEEVVYSIEKVYEKLPSYNLEIEDCHNYFAEDILVHNDKVFAWYQSSTIQPKTWSWSADGTYYVTLNVRDNDEGESSATVEITIGGNISD